ncbi:unnamed protein product [Aphanomyces euteiches]
MPRTGRNREANALDPTRSVVTLRLVDDTRAQYNFYIQRMKRFLLASFPQFVVNSEIQLPLTLEVCEAYLDYASVKRDKDGNEIIQGSTIRIQQSTPVRVRSNICTKKRIRFLRPT